MDKCRSPLYQRGCRGHGGARTGWSEGVAARGRARFGMETTFQSGSPARLGGKSLASETRQARAQTASPAYQWGGLGELAGPLALSFLFRKSRAPVAIRPPALGFQLPGLFAL